MPEKAEQKTILVVEDEHETRALIVLILEQAGYRVLEAADAEEGKRVWGSGSSIDLFMLDVWLPGASGVDLASLIRKQDPSAKILFMSGLNPRPSMKELSLMNKEPFLSKPFGPASVLAMVRGVLSERR